MIINDIDVYKDIDKLSIIFNKKMSLAKTEL